MRRPAHCCGVYALKPSYGVVPNLGYLDHVGGGTTRTDINTFGPMARSADDLELLLSVLAGPIPEDAPAWRVELPASPVHVAGRAPGRDVARRRRVPGRRASTSACCAAPPTRSPTPARSVEDAHPDVAFRDQMDVYHAPHRGRGVAEHARRRRRADLAARTSSGSATTSERAAFRRHVGRVVRGLRRAARAGVVHRHRSSTTTRAT